jgi:hypothetical protein
MAKRKKPVTFRTKCGTVGYNIGAANGRCGQMSNRKRCTDGISSALNENDWVECPACIAEGSKDGKTCMRCDGSGWMLVRDLPWLAE